MSATIGDMLARDGLINPSRVVPFYPRTRDREDIQVLKCLDSGVIFLDRQLDDVESTYLVGEPGTSRLCSETLVDGQNIQITNISDAERRLEQFRALLVGKKVLDFGAGDGAFLDLASNIASEAVGVELSPRHVADMRSRGISCERDVGALNGKQFEVITMFHCLEHLTNPVETIAMLGGVLSSDGQLIVEVPHARDFLLEDLGCPTFLAFTFWSQHLVLHTHESLQKSLQLAGFGDIEIQGYQRYGLENHLYWLAKGLPGGHEQWAKFRSAPLNDAYSDALASWGRTDTLIAFAAL